MLATIRTALAALLLSPLVAMAATSTPPSLDQIIAKNIAARGGMAKIKAIRSLKSSGHIAIGPMVLDVAIDNPRGAFRSDTSINGTTKTEAFDGSHGWFIDPFTKGPAAGIESMSATQLRQVALQMDFDGPLVDYRSKGTKISLLGTQRVNGIDAYALKIALKDGNALTMFIDTKNYMEIADDNNAVSEGKIVEVETMLGDYRAVNGVLFPFALDIRPKGQPDGLKIRLDKVEANTVVDRTRFTMPATVTHAASRPAKTP